MKNAAPAKSWRGGVLRLGPRSLTGQIIAVAAIALFIAQSINFYFILSERRKESTIIASSMASARIGNAINDIYGETPNASRALSIEKRRQHPAVGRMLERLPLVASRQHIAPEGQPANEDMSLRALSLLQEAYPSVRHVRVTEVAREALPPLLQLKKRNDTARPTFNESGRPQRRPAKSVIVVAAEMSDGNILTAAAPIRQMDDPIGLWLIGQTLFLYLAVLLPLALFGFWLARPLRRLRERADAVGQSVNASPLIEEGPQDVRELTRAFNAMQSRVGNLLGEKDVMLGAIGHDLKTPLASLRLRLETLEIAAEEEADRDKMIGSILEMNLMLDDILTLARLGRSAEPLEKVNLAALAAALADDYEDRGEPVRLAEGNAHVPPMSVRPVLVRRALRNLIENAVAYGGAAEISLSEFADGLNIDIADRGAGISEAEREALFEPFHRADSSRNRRTGGSGLGLTIARAIARQHGGDVQLLPRDGGGTIARFSLRSS